MLKNSWKKKTLRGDLQRHLPRATLQNTPLKEHGPPSLKRPRSDPSCTPPPPSLKHRVRSRPRLEHAFTDPAQLSSDKRGQRTASGCASKACILETESAVLMPEPESAAWGWHDAFPACYFCLPWSFSRNLLGGTNVGCGSMWRAVSWLSMGIPPPHLS